MASVIKGLGDHPLTPCSSGDVAKLCDWLIAQGMARDTVEPVFGGITSIINLTIKEPDLLVKIRSQVPSGLRIYV